MSDATSSIDPAIAARIAALEATIATQQAALEAALARADDAEAERDRLREAYYQLQLEVELARRRIVIAKAERIDTTQLELEFADKLAALDRLAGRLADEDQDGDDEGAGAPKRTRKRGRRQLRALVIREERIEVTDPTREGKFARIGFEEACDLRWQRGGQIRVVFARAKYADEAKRDGVSVSAPSSKVDDVPVKTHVLLVPPGVSAAALAELKPGSIYTAPMPPKILPRSIASASLVAHIASDKFCDGLPLHRQEDRFARSGVPIDRGSMCRWLADVGLTLGATVVEAMRKEALATAFCIATDATGVLVQPIRDDKNQASRPCRRGHFFVQIADADHVFFEYTPKETSAAVGEMFRGFSGYVQADAKSVYDFLYRRPDQRPPPEELDDGALRVEVGCWSHLRTKLWEAAIATKDPAAREGLARIMRMFQLERTWKKKSASERKSLRDVHLRPHVEQFFEFARAEYEHVKNRRGLVRTAFGYAVRQEQALVRFLDDARLPMTNNHSERELRRVAVGRKAWLFVGSDEHGQAAGNWLTLIASARLHGLDPEQYLRDLLCVLPQWPGDRYLELAPKYWRQTRARLDDAQLELETAWFTIPPPLFPPADAASSLTAAP